MKSTCIKKAISLSLALLILLSSVACGNPSSKGTSAESTSNTPAAPAESTAPSTKEVTYKDRVVIANSATLAKLDPHSNNTEVNGQLYELTHNTLVTCDYNKNEIIGELAYEWEQPDNLTYIFKLREGITFHNGDPFTAEDVIYSLNRAAGSSYQMPKLKDIASMEAVDDYTLKITLSQANADFLINLCTPNLSIVCQSAIEADDKKGVSVGTGAYVMTEWVPDDYTLVTRNDNFWGELPITKEIVYRKYAEESARVIALQTGEVDICMDVPYIEASHVSDSKGCSLLQIPSTMLIYVALNASGFNSDLANAKVRQALNYATDTDSLILAMTEGYAQPAHGIIPTNVWGYSSDVSAYSYDVEKAKALLTEAGYPNGLDVSFTYNKSIYPGLYELLQAQWAQAGINLTLNTDDGTVRSQQLKEKNYDMTVANWSFAATGTDLSGMWSSTSGSNRTLTKDPKLDAMLDKALMELDETKREAMYAELSQYVTDNAAVIPMYIKTLMYGVGDTVDGYTFYGNSRHEFTYVTAQK